MKLFMLLLSLALVVAVIDARRQYGKSMSKRQMYETKNVVKRNQPGLEQLTKRDLSTLNREEAIAYLKKLIDEDPDYMSEEEQYEVEYLIKKFEIDYDEL